MKKNKIIVLKLNITMRDTEVDILENKLSKKFGRKVIILDGNFSNEILTI